MRRVDVSLIPTEILDMPDFGPNSQTIGGPHSRGATAPYHIAGGASFAAVTRISLCCLGQTFEMISSAYAQGPN